MSAALNEWKQEGRVFVWRYSEANRARRGWHFSGDRLGCASFCDLLDRLRDQGGAYRTWQLEDLPDLAWSSAGFGQPMRDNFRRLRVSFEAPNASTSLEVEADLLNLTMGSDGLGKLHAGFKSLWIGQGDFGFRPNSKSNTPAWMFWWVVPNQTEN